MKKTNLSKKILSLILCLSFISQQTGLAQTVVQLDIAGYLRGGSNVVQPERFRPLYLRYLGYDSINNDFKLLLDKGTELGKDVARDKEEQILKNKTKEVLDYFFIGISLPNESFWVNLRPDSPDNIIDGDLAKTDMGRILLEADMQLKKDTARMTSPETEEGKEYWDMLYKKAGELFGSENITIPTLTRPWIVPDEIIIRDSSDNAYIYKATLKVMLEQDYLKGSKEYNFNDERLKELNEYSTKLIRENIIPNLTKEVNIGKNYASLRKVYHSLILAQWFKQKFSGKIGPYSRMIDRKSLQGLTSKETWSKDTYFKEYQKNFQKGEYNLKEQVYTLGQGKVVRSYMSGGIALEGIQKVTQNVILDGLTSSSPIREAMLGSGGINNVVARSYHEGEIKPIGFPFEQPQQKTTVGSPIKKPSIFALGPIILSALLALSSCGQVGTEYPEPNPPGYNLIENFQVYTSNFYREYKITTDNGRITTAAADIQHRGVSYSLLDLKNSGRTLDTNTGYISYVSYPNTVTLTFANNPKEYSEALELMIKDVRGALEIQGANPPLTTEQVDFLNQVLALLNYQLMQNFQVYISNGLIQYAITANNGKITTKESGITLHTSGSGYTLNTKEGSISYIPYPYSWDQEDRRVTFTFANNPKEYSDTLELMIKMIKGALQMQGANPPLTDVQIDFLNKVLALLNNQLMQNFQIYFFNGVSAYTIKVDNGKLTTIVSAVGLQTIYTLDTKTGTISYNNSDQEETRVTFAFADNPKTYSNILQNMIYNVKLAKGEFGQPYGPIEPFGPIQIDFLDKVLALLKDQMMQNFQVYISNGIMEYKIESAFGRITTSESDIPLGASRSGAGYSLLDIKNSGYTLDTNTGYISYMPYPRSLYEVDNRLTLTFANNPKEYSDTLGSMIRIMKGALGMQGANPPLTPEQDDFLNKVLVKLEKSLLSPDEQPGSSPIIDSKAEKGGIDFRALPIITKPMLINPGVNLNLNFTAPIPAAELENERSKIKNMLGAGIIPSSERIADYLISSYQKKDGFNQEVDNVFYFLADILRIEEERVLPTEPAFKQILGMLEQISG